MSSLRRWRKRLHDCKEFAVIPVHLFRYSFMTTALNQSNVKVTWDETEPGRLRATMRKFDKKDILDMDFKAYLASSSDEDCDNSGEEIVNNQQHDSDNDDDSDDDKRIEKYKVNTSKNLVVSTYFISL